jgi:hypothetical protein
VYASEQPDLPYKALVLEASALNFALDIRSTFFIDNMAVFLF